MRTRELKGAIVAVVGAIVMGWGGNSPARSELRATVEDSTTIVVTRGDSVVFRREVPFAIELGSKPLAWDAGYSKSFICFDYVPRDSALVNPLPHMESYDGSRWHLLVTRNIGQELFSGDVAWQSVGPERMVLSSPETLLVFRPDIGEVCLVPLETNAVNQIRVSEWGRVKYPEEEGITGRAVVVGPNRVLLVRSDYTDPQGPRSEVTLVTGDGNVLWQRTDPGTERYDLVVEPDGHLLIQARRHASAEGYTLGFDIQALDMNGREAWVLDVGYRVVRKLELDGDVLRIWVQPLGRGSPGEKMPWERVEVGARSGQPVGVER